ncbi:MAG: hypothetical protein ACYC3Q_01035 [Gemmatimonadaceae bacterium]
MISSTDLHPGLHPTSTAFDRLLALREEIGRCTPRPEAEAKVQVSVPHSRSSYLSLLRVSGERADVLGYVASLFASDRAARQRGGDALELVAIEHEAEDELSLLLSRNLWSGE